MRVVNAAAAVKFRDGQPSMTARQALQATGQPHALDSLNAKRLQYLPRLLQNAPPPLLVLLDLAPSWRKALLADLLWIAERSSKLA